jgi:RNA polymerase sigma factor (sigma-70 family)
MANGQLGAVLGHLRRLVGPAASPDGTDGHLLKRFVCAREEGAFAALLQRHGPLVLGVCRRVLDDPANADDVFQATFLVLVRRAASIKKRESLASWLYGVAYRLARRANADAIRRRAHERQVATVAATGPGADDSWRELWPTVDDELSRLPEKYRAPLVLCYLQGKTQEEAARLLGWPKGSLSTRVGRGLQRLRGRLARRGLTLSAAALATALSPKSAPAALPAALADSTLQAALLCAAGKPALALISARAAALTEGALRTMFMTRLKIAAALLLMVAVAGSGAALFAGRGNEGADEPRAVDQPKTADQKPKDGGEDKGQPEDRLAVAKARAQSRLNLKGMALAMHNFHDTMGYFPPPAIYSKDGKPLLSWRVAILPYVEQDALYRAFKLDEPWDSEHNKKLLAQMPKIYAPVGGVKTKVPHSTFYQVFAGKGTAFEPGQKIRLVDITDGSSNTIMVVDAATPVPWTKPEDLAYVEDQKLPKLGGLFPDVFHAVFCDGQVYTLTKKFDELTMRAVITRAGGEVISLDAIRAPVPGSAPEPGKKDADQWRDENRKLKLKLESAMKEMEAIRQDLELWAEIPQEEGASKNDPRIDRLVEENLRLKGHLAQTQARIEAMKAELERLKKAAEKPKEKK